MAQQAVREPERAERVGQHDFAELGIRGFNNALVSRSPDAGVEENYVEPALPQFREERLDLGSIGHVDFGNRQAGGFVLPDCLQRAGVSASACRTGHVPAALEELLCKAKAEATLGGDDEDGFALRKWSPDQMAV